MRRLIKYILASLFFFIIFHQFKSLPIIANCRYRYPLLEGQIHLDKTYRPDWPMYSLGVSQPWLLQMSLWPGPFLNSCDRLRTLCGVSHLKYVYALPSPFSNTAKSGLAYFLDKGIMALHSVVIHMPVIVIDKYSAYIDRYKHCQ